jgi:myosin heavy subunit
MVQGAVVQKYLLEKSRIVSQGSYERNYHVFYYLLSGATDLEREALHLLPADKYHYLNAKNLTLENCDEKYEFSRLKQSMEMVGFSAEKQRRLFNVLSAVLLLGNVEFFPKKSTYHHDESVQVRNPDVVAIISELLKVKQETLMAALTSKRVKASGETLIMQYKLPEAIAARDALAKCLYGALFDWIVLQVGDGVCTCFAWALFLMRHFPSVSALPTARLGESRFAEQGPNTAHGPFNWCARHLWFRGFRAAKQF